MAFCHECGSALAPDEHFCGECGTPAPTDTSPAPTVPLPTMPPPIQPFPTVPPPTEAHPTVPPPTEVYPTVPPPTEPPPTSNHQRLAMYIGGGVIVLLLGVVLLLWTRGGDDDASVATEPAVSTTLATVQPATTVAVTTTTLPPSTTEVTTTEALSTAPSTEPPTTPAPLGPIVEAGWRPAQMIPEAEIPPFDASWIGAPSPPIVDPNAPVPDGVYWVDYVAQDGASLTLTLGRFESCSILNDEYLCGPGPYGSNAIGRVNPGERDINVPLDDTVRIVIQGWDCSSVTLEGNGADLGAMYAALGADYTRAFADGLNAGGDPYDLMVAARDDPSTGFTAPPAECDDEYSLVWRFGSAPPVLIQGVVDYDTGGAMDPAMLIAPTAIQLVGDQTTVYFYAGFYS